MVKIHSDEVVDLTYVTKSPNRLVHALWYNRPVATQSFPSLGSLERFVSVKERLGAAITQIADNWPGMLVRTLAGRGAVQYIDFMDNFGGRIRTRTYGPLIKSQLH